MSAVDLQPGARGTIESTIVAELVGQAFARGLTGCLSLDHAGIWSRIYTRHGAVIGAQLYMLVLPLGDVLRQLGWIDEETLVRCLAEVREGRLLGEVLVAMGKIEPNQLFRALDLQQKTNVHLLLALTEGKWEWSAERAPPWTADVIVDPVPILADAIVSRYGALDAGTLLATLLPSGRVRLSERGGAWLPALALSKDELRAARRLADPTSLDGWVAGGTLAPERARGLVAALALCGCVVDPSRPEAPASAELALHEPSEAATAGGDLGLALTDSLVSEMAEVLEIEIDVEEAAPAPEPAPRPVPAGARSRLLAKAFREMGMVPRAPAEGLQLFEPEAPEPLPSPDDPPEVAEVHAWAARIEAQDYFQRLELPRSATTDGVQRAFRALALRFHPDRATGVLAPLAGKMKEIFAALTEAQSTLQDPKSRAAYLTRLEAREDPDAGNSGEKAMAARLLYEKGQALLRRRDYRAAEEHFRQAFQMHPERGNYAAWQAWAVLADPVRSATSRGEVRAVLQQAMKDPKADRAHHVAGVLSRVEGDLERAITAFEKALSINGQNGDAERELKFLRTRMEKERKGGGWLSKLRRRE